MNQADRLNKDAGIAHWGNPAKLIHCMKRAAQKEPLTIGFLGGSITQGSLASNPKWCYARRVFSWWEKTYPDTAFTYVNAGIGGTTSHFGVARVEDDLLCHNPDLVFLEFSVNDESNEHFQETYEGVVRRILKSPKAPALILLHNVYYHNGANAQVIHSEIGRHYNLACISMQSSIYPEVVAGKLARRQITPDDLHPNDFGHELVALVITHYLELIRQKSTGDCTVDLQNKIPQPLTQNTYENTVRYNSKNSKPDCHGFRKDTSVQTQITDCFKYGWEASHEGDWIAFRVAGSAIAIQYRKSVKKPAPCAMVLVDGIYQKTLDANFDEDWGDKLELDTITEHVEFGTHEVKIILSQTADAIVPFYLTSIIVAGEEIK